MARIRRAGFTEYADTLDSFEAPFTKLRTERIIPTRVLAPGPRNG